ncbi:MAG TPA: hypothetical protein VLQ91_14580 [Draconibacterium sp.]|nr:hypothetical protein [Draconibacterium sp.]
MFIFKINALTNLIAFIIGCIHFKYFSKEIKIVFYFVAFGVATEIFTRFYKHFWMQNTGPIGHFYFPVAFFIMGMFFLMILKDFIKPAYILILIISFEVFSLINVLFIQDLYEFPSLTGSIGAMILFLFSVAFFTKVMTEAKILKLAQEPLIWINSAVLVYYTGNFIFYVLLNYANNYSREFALLTVKFFSYINLLFYLLIAIGFWKVKKVKS